jgi:mutator protein MutT
VIKKQELPVKKLTLGYLVKENQVLLAMKKRGFGEGKWNGVGGKVQDGETIEKALIREAEEEIGVTPTIFQKIATLDFYYPGKDGGVINRVFVFLVTEWTGRIIESSEMKPKWFKKTSLPYANMWVTDKLWFSKILKGEIVKGDFFYDIDYNFLDFKWT